MITSLFLLLINVSNAKLEFNNSKFIISSKSIDFFNYDKLRITGNEKCIEKNNFCENYLFLKTISLTNSNTSIASNNNFGAEICVNNLKGTVIIGIDLNGNENSFCKIKSGIIVDNGTLRYYGTLNEHGKEFIENKRSSPK